MANTTGTRSDFGRDVDMFAAQFGVAKTFIAEKAGVHYQFMCNCCYGRYGRNGTELKKKVYAFMEEYAAENAGEVNQ